jgi:periplasmic divalent cation tolerance protein
VSALIWSTFATEADAERAANVLLDEGLIACANLIPGVRSLYRWNDERGEGREVAALFKTDGRRLDDAVARLAELHPYDTPAIVGWRVDATTPATAEWLGLAGGKLT